MQQHSVLSCNLSQNVDRFCGAMGTDLWAKQTWDDHFSKNMVIVVTAEVLVQCLFHSFISIEQINLLIFDEAHHAKKNHPYARIVRDFYLAQEDKAKRPKIFGMTASPIDVKADDFHIAAAELETLLQCQIATTSDLSLLQKFVFRPVEREIKYDRVPPPYETPFHVLIRSRFGHLDALKRSFVASKETAAELGEWPADFYWSSALSEAQASRKKRKVEVDFNKQKIDNAMEKLDKNLTHLQEAADFVKDHSFGEPTLNSLSSKVVELHKCLQEYFQQPTEARCIVFVERRHTARLLCEIFERIGGPYLKPGTLTGTNKSDEVNITFKQQVLSLQKFRNGEVNCLFATSIAEEGLDIPACNLVVRFDLYKTMIQYVQSRGRARHRDSKFIYMIEEGNNGHLYTVHSARIDEQMMRSFCKAVPEDRLLKGNDDIGDLSFMASKGRSYTEQTTGAKLTYESSLVVLAHFVASLPSEGDEALAPT